jgi:hypothetical protein
VTNAPRFVAAYILHRKAREAALARQLEKGESDIPALVSAIYANLDPRLTRAAGMSVLAHLEDLVARGTLAMTARLHCEPLSPRRSAYRLPAVDLSPALDAHAVVRCAPTPGVVLEQVRIREALCRSRRRRQPNAHRCGRRRRRDEAVRHRRESP